MKEKKKKVKQLLLSKIWIIKEGDEMGKGLHLGVEGNESVFLWGLGAPWGASMGARMNDSSTLNDK